MKDAKPTLQEILHKFLDLSPKLDGTKRRIALATYRRVARGVPASPEEIASDARRPAEEVKRILGDWIGVFADTEGRVYGFWGLSISAMKHRFEVDGVRLHTWCAWDAIFLPGLLDKTARVESVCAQSGQPVRLTVSPTGVESAEPSSVFISFLLPDVRHGSDIINRFCHYVNFFRSQADGEAWIAKTPGTFLLTLDQGVELARMKNQAQFGALLETHHDSTSGGQQR
jgi:alkylmercury lyase